ncbi:hypothetical protein GCM10007231_13140 [Nocardioides daphniae]|uniref:Uncharacterized protein n=1 Tax=Nocardioides daphniae TaxID=402297 RepID=A0ABQ1Q6W9_9ACTN|nr:hypothetical protein GCM10007231_13140 [Nocardioides daphniae]
MNGWRSRPLPESRYPWREAGLSRATLLDELLRLGYTGSVSKTASDLWRLILERR